MTEQLTKPAETPESAIHCDRCRSDLQARHLLRRDWQGQAGPACPNCGTILGSDRQPAEGTALGYDDPHAGPGALQLCAACQRTYRRVAIDMATGETRPVRFCPHCGHQVAA